MKTLSTSTQNSPFGGFRGLLALLLFLLWAIGGFAQGSVSNMATDYTANKVSFTLTWTTQPHDNRIWVIVDYIKVENASTAGNTWKRAPVMAVARNAGAGSVATAIGQRGFWLNTSGSSGSANVTATLNPDTDIQLYNWCAYVLNYPPEAKIKPEGGYNLNGTPPFTINGALNINSETFGAGTCITSITDATGNPAGIIPPAPAATVTSPTICYNTTATLSATVGGGTTTAMTYTWNINGATSVTTAPTITTTQSLTTATTYTVTLRNANGCTSAVSDIGTITVRTNFTPNSIATTGQTICSGGAVTTIGNATAASGGDGAISYQWYRNGSAITGATATTYAPTAYASTVGAQTFTRHAKDGTCNTTLTASTGQWVLTVLADPTVTITAAQTICNGVAGSALTATPSGGSGSNTYTWQWGTTTACSDGSSTSTANTLATGNLTASRYYRVMVTQSVSGCASAYSAAVLKTVRTAFSVGAIATTGQTICSGGAVTTIGNATAASGGDGAISYQWYRNGSAITSATATTYAPTAYASTVGAQTFTRRAKDGTCNTTLTASTGQWVLTVNAKPTITYLSSGSTTQTVYAGSTITPIKYTTANATGASISGQPAGVSGAWTSPDYTVSGTPSATGTFNYTVTTTNSNGCANVTATGKIVVDPALPPNSGTATWSCGTQVWSGLLRNPVAGCANVTALSTTDPPPAQYKYVSTSDRYYYNWTCVNDAAAALCPSPWRVPTQDDFNELVSCTNYSVLISQWGYGGYALESTISGESANAALWSTTISSTGTAYLLFNESGQIRLLSLSKFYGIQVRCVQ